VTTRIVVAGASGRMGQALIAAALADASLEIVSALDVATSDAIGRDIGNRDGRTTGVVVSSDVAAALANADVLVDFTRPEGTRAHIAACIRAGVGAVIGTTGLAESDKSMLRDAARTVPIVFASNMSVGVNVMLTLAALAATSLGDAYDVEIVEMHHRHKVDAPSGTALALGEAIASATERDLARDGVFARHGTTGERAPRSIGFATLRGGDVVGEHTVVFAGEGERIEISHKAASRANFARGALRAAHFVAARRARGETGLFDMQDVLGLRASPA